MDQGELFMTSDTSILHISIFSTVLLISACQSSSPSRPTPQVQPEVLYSYPHRLVVNKYDVIDGDTLNIYDENNQKTRVRLTGIDAPESNQSKGIDSLNQLKNCLNPDHIQINWATKDRYDRLLAKVISDGKDCNLKQIEAGMAWHYKYFEKDQPELDRAEYGQAEINAKKNAVGLWSESCPTPPWDWRKNKTSVCTDQ